MNTGKILCIALVTSFSSFFIGNMEMKMQKTYTIDSLGACQGISLDEGKVFLYGDREVGVLRQFSYLNDSLIYNHKEYKFTIGDKNIINHPTGIAKHGDYPVFIGNSIRLNKAGTSWKAMIYCINWKGFLQTGTLDGNLINTIEDDACIQGTRPEYVQYEGRWFVATADYGNHGNEVRLYDPEKLKQANKTLAQGVLYKKFKCTPWVQNLFWMDRKNILVLIQNQVEGRKWRFTFLDLKKSLETGSQSVLKVIDLDARQDELEGFAFTGSELKAIAVTSSRKMNVSHINVSWK